MARKLDVGDQVLITAPAAVGNLLWGAPAIGKMGVVVARKYDQRHSLPARALYLVARDEPTCTVRQWFTYDALELYTPPPVDDQSALERWLST